MDCPICKNPMIVLEIDKVETDYCAACGGIWLDYGELEQLYEDAHQADRLINSFKKAKGVTEKIRKCPICLKKMEKIFIADENKPVVIDRCSKLHGLWFDKGELLQVLERGGLDKEEKMVKLLSEIFLKK